MNFCLKLFLATSCYLPLYIIILIRNIHYVFNEYDLSHDFIAQSEGIKYNFGVGALVFLLAILGVWGIIQFRDVMLDSQKRASEIVKLEDAENITDRNFFTYFSFFVVAFISVDPVDPQKIIDLIILSLVLVTSVIVYIRNSLYFLNPVLNVLGYRSYRMTYRRYHSDTLMSNKSTIDVFSKLDLKREIGSDVFIDYSESDFSVCRKMNV